MSFKEQETMGYYLSHLSGLSIRQGARKSCFFNKLCHKMQKRLQTISLLALLWLHYPSVKDTFSECLCLPISPHMPYQNTAASTVTKAMLRCNELMNRIWEYRSSHSPLSSTAIYTNTSVDIFGPIKAVILIM